MTTTDIPADLIALKRDFIQTDADLAALSKTMPSGPAIVAGEAEEDPADRARWNVLNDRLGTLTEEINAHPAFEGLVPKDRYELDKAASKAARAGL